MLDSPANQTQIIIDDSEALDDTPKAQVNVVLTNMCNTTFHAGTFLLPSKEPLNDLSHYRVIYHQSAACHQVIARKTGQHNYNAMIIPYVRLVPRMRQLEVITSRCSETSHTSPGTSEPAATTEEEHADEIPSAAFSHGPTSELVPEYYTSSTGKDWAKLDEEARHLLDSKNQKRSKSSNATDEACDKAVPSPTTSTGTFFEKNGLIDAELQDIRYGDLSREIVSLDLDGIPMKRARKGWNKVPCVQVLDLQVRDVNDATLADCCSNDESSVTDHDEGFLDNQIPSKGKANTELELPDLRQYIPDDVSRDIQIILENSNEDFRDRIEWAQGQVYWFHMCQASQRLLESGESKRRPLFAETGRSVNHQVGSGVRTAKASRPEARPIHHYNFNGDPVYCKSSTPPAVSYWVAESPALRYRPDYDGRLHRTVTSSEAAKYVDPYSKHGPEVIEVIGGTALREKVTDQVEKLYSSHGTWSKEVLDKDDDIPINGGEAPICTNVFCPHVNLLPRLPNQVDVGDPIVNDDGRYHPPAKPRDRTVVGRPARLRWVEKADDEEGKSESKITRAALQDAASGGDEVHRELPPQEEAVEEEAIAPSATTDTTDFPCKDQWAAWLAKIHHLQSLPIEVRAAYMIEEWSQPSNARSKNQHDLAKWSEEPEKEDDYDLMSFSPDDLKSSRVPDYPITESQSNPSAEILEQYMQSEPEFEVPDHEPGTPCEENPEAKDITLDLVTAGKRDDHVHFPQRNMPELDHGESPHRDETKLTSESTKGAVVKGFTIATGANSQPDIAPIKVTVEKSQETPPIGKPPVIDFDKAIKAINSALCAEDSGRTMALTIGSIATISRPSEHGSDTVREIDDCLNEIKALASPFFFRTPRPSPFKRPQEEMGFRSDFSKENSESNLSETSFEHSDIVIDRWSSSSKEPGSGTQELCRLRDADRGTNISVSSESPCPKQTEDKLAFTGSQMLYDEARNLDLAGISKESINDGTDWQDGTGSECSENIVWEDVEIGGEPIHAFVSKYRTDDSLEETSRDSYPSDEGDILKGSEPSIQGPGSESSDTTHSQDSSSATDISDDGVPEVPEMETETDRTKAGSNCHRYQDAATQAEDPACDDEAEPPVGPNPPNFDYGGLFNLSMPKVSLPDCLLYGGAVLVLGYQAYRAFRR